MELYQNISKQNAPSCVALGCFDGIHIGHRKIINDMCSYAKQNNLISSVFTFSTSPAALLGKTHPRLLMSQADKLSLLAELGVEKCFDIDFFEVMNTEPELFITDILIKALNVKAVFCGFNNRFGKAARGDSDLLKRICRKEGVEVFVAEPICLDGEVVSSSRIRTLIENGEMTEANRLLGHTFSVDEPILEGKHNGRKVGVPTVNQFPSGDYVTPRFGVYASFVYIDGIRYSAITNVGVRPTVNGKDKNYETHILGDFSRELYGQKVRTELLAFVRPERRFDDLRDLSEQIQRDIEFVKAHKIWDQDSADNQTTD